MLSSWIIDREYTLILLDGGMGQELVRRFRYMTGRPATPLWSTQVLLDAPELVSDLHAEYLSAGADVLTLATYSATPERLERDGLSGQFAAMQQAGLDCAQRARRASGRDDVRLAACLPPLVASYRADLLPERSVAEASYRAIVAAQQPGCDLLLCETMASMAAAEVAASVALESGLPVWVALTIEDSLQTDGTPRLRSGEPLDEATCALVALGVDATLLNCSTPEAIDRALPVLSSSGLPFGAYANAFRSVEALRPGGTVDALERRDDLDPVAYADMAALWIASGASIVGGCCETTPAHIAEMHRRRSTG